MAACYSRLRASLAAWVASGTPTVAKFQHLCGVTEQGPTNWLLHPIFAVGAALGNELFFITFLPWVFWELDWAVGRRVMHLWVTVYFLGQVCKDVLQLPRPPAASVVDSAGLAATSSTPTPTSASAASAASEGSGPGKAAVAPLSLYDQCKAVVRLERHYETEYGMPSTHAMNAVTMPGGLLILILSSGRYEGSAGTLAGLCAAWALSCTSSRLYMGVHSPADILVGLAFGALLLTVHMLYGAWPDALLLTSPWAAVAVPALAVALIAVYPRPSGAGAPLWVSTPGDTAVVVGSWAGLSLGASAPLLGGHHKAAMGARILSTASTSTTPPHGFGQWLQSVLMPWGPVVWGLPVATPSSGSGRGLAFGAMRYADVAGVPQRIVLGFLVLVVTRAVVKAVAVPLLSYLAGDAWAPASEVGVVDDANNGRHSGLATPGSIGASSETGTPGGGDATASRVIAPPAGGAASFLGSTAEGQRDVAGSSGKPRLRIKAPVQLEGSTPPTPSTASSATRLAADGVTLLVRIPPPRRYAVELPVKLLTYSAVGFNTVYTVPYLFQALGWKDYGL